MNPIDHKALAAWPLLATEVLIFGTACFALVEDADPGPCAPSMTRMLTPLWRGLALAACLACPVILLVGASQMADLSLRDTIPFLPQVLRETHFGRVCLWTFPLLIGMVVIAWLPGGWPAKPGGLSATACVLLLLGSLWGHAIDRGAVAVVVYFIHEVAAGLWTGAIFGLLLGGTYGKFTAARMERTTRRVSRLAGWSVAALAVTGLYTAVGSLDRSWNRLFYSLYGRTLLWKLATVGIVLLLGAFNRYRLMPAIEHPPAQATLVRSVAAECVLLVGVLAWSALLANTPPPH